VAVWARSSRSASGLREAEVWAAFASADSSDCIWVAMEFEEEEGLGLRFLDGGGSERMGAGIVWVGAEE